MGRGQAPPEKGLSGACWGWNPVQLCLTASDFLTRGPPWAGGAQGMVNGGWESVLRAHRAAIASQRAVGMEG